MFTKGSSASIHLASNIYLLKALLCIRLHISCGTETLNCEEVLRLTRLKHSLPVKNEGSIERPIKHTSAS